MTDDLHFGYSAKVSLDGHILNLEFRFDEHCTYRLLVESLRALADDYEKQAEAGALDKELE